MSIRRLFAILMAVALLLAPALTRAGEVRAAVPDHHGQTMESGHCDAPPADSGDRGEAQANGSCLSMCVAVAIAPPAPAGESAIKPLSAMSVIPPLHLSYLGEIATPPPRRS